MRSDKDATFRVILGVVAGIVTAIVTFLLFSVFSVDLSDLFTDPYWMEWVWFLIALLTPIISGLMIGLEGEAVWKILLFTFLRGISVSLFTFLIFGVIQMFIDGTILFAILALGLCMPATQLVIIVFKA